MKLNRYSEILNLSEEIGKFEFTKWIVCHGYCYHGQLNHSVFTKWSMLARLGNIFDKNREDDKFIVDYVGGCNWKFYLDLSTVLARSSICWN